jgi:quinoprotein glucose dehydrogenase
LSHLETALHRPSAATVLACLILTFTAGTVAAGDAVPTKRRPNEPKIVGPSKQAELAMAGFQTPKGMRTSLFAAEPLVANPVSFFIDARGRFFVCETFRQSKGVEDNRGHGHWLHDDLAAQSVDDRLAYFKKHLKDKIWNYTKEDDRIRLIQDSNGDGKADKATVFAAGFNGILEGTGAGVLARGGDVYYTNIPHLWKLRDTNGDGKADVRTPLLRGFGVRVAFRGHDMHGLTMGPDGRLYFSIGDRGFNVVTKEGQRLKRPDTGAVFRCELDGSHLEVFAWGLRNPQELAFDDYGNLFTGDNNCDSGDRSRWVYVVPGSDSGWRMYYQYLGDRGPWNREMIWYPHDEPPLRRSGPGGTPAGSVAAKIQPAFIVPPVANVADGPAGLTYYPGVGLPKRYKGHFFLVDFRGNSGSSGVRSFAVKPKGAGFELVDSHQFIWKVLATDVDFGYDGAMYVSDWVSSWEGVGKGRLYRFAFPQLQQNADVTKLMRDGFAERSTLELTQLLEHPDRRIRLEAQFALASHKDALIALRKIAVDKSRPLITRLHGIWGLGQLARAGNAQAGSALSGLLYGQPAEILAQAARTFGDALNPADKKAQHCLQTGGRERLRKLLAHDNPRVRSFAAIALGRLGEEASLPALQKLLADNADKDPILRHAAVMGLAGIGWRHLDALLKRAAHPDKSVRLGVIVALRRIAWRRQRAMEDNPISERSPGYEAAVAALTRFLSDTETDLVLEAARAFDEIDAPSGMVKLAAISDRPGMPDALLRRVLNANLRVGGTANATAVAKLAVAPHVPENLRLEAIAELRSWNNPPPLDRVLGKWRPVGKRKAIDVAAVIRPYLAGLFAGPNKVRQEAAKLASGYGIKEVGPLLLGLFHDAKRPATVRVAALRALSALKNDRLSVAIDSALKDADAAVRAEGLALLAKRDPAKAVPLLERAIASGKLVEKQSAVAVLGRMKTKASDALLEKWMRRLIARNAPAEIQLDLLLAANHRGLGRFYELLEQFEKTRPKNDPLAKYRETLAGGDADRGRAIFLGRSDVSCLRCHKVNDEGGAVGPDLSGVGLQKKRDYLLESIVLPNKTIAKGFDSVVLAMDSGKVYSGIIKSDDGKTIRLMQATGQIVTLKKASIDARAKGKSAMPEDVVKHLSKRDLRDLVEFLSRLRKPPRKENR